MSIGPIDIDSLLSQLQIYNQHAPLTFSSGLFLFLFTGFTFFYRFMRRDVTLRIVYVILFSLYFYYKTSGIFFFLLIIVSLSDFFIGKAMVRKSCLPYRKWLMALSVVINLGLLIYFKYTNFFIEIINSMASKDWLDFKNIFLPVGISFFIFQSLSYTIDIYRSRIEPLKNWLDYLFYLSFFPQLVAGPIVRARDFIPQIRQNPLVVTRKMFGMALFLIVSGLFKKAVISDYISLNFVDRVFDDPLLYSGFENLMSIYGYGLQIYCDFSGYSDMAIGIALMLGFRFNKNFDSPYKSATITEFWRRWHISLSSWLKDYLYVSLGGNRHGKLRTYLNLMITMLLGGLWHGAALRFIIWGALHGLALAFHKAIMSCFRSFKTEGTQMVWWRQAIGTLLTFNFVCFTWIFFRAKDIATGIEMLKQIFNNFNFKLIPEVISGYCAVFVLMALGYALHMMPRRWELLCERLLTRANIFVVSGALAVVIWVIMQIKSSEIQPFIYFQF